MKKIVLINYLLAWRIMEGYEGCLKFDTELLIFKNQISSWLSLFTKPA